MARTMNDEEMTEFVGWVESHHPEIISEFELRDVTLDTADSTPFPLKFSPAQEQVFSRMHLDIDMAKELVKQLQHFIETEELFRNEDR